MIDYDIDRIGQTVKTSMTEITTAGAALKAESKNDAA